MIRFCDGPMARRDLLRVLDGCDAPKADPLHGSLIATEWRASPPDSRFWVLESGEAPVAALCGRTGGLFYYCGGGPSDWDEPAEFLRFSGCRTLLGPERAVAALYPAAGLPPPRSGPVLRWESGAVRLSPRVRRVVEDFRDVYRLLEDAPEGYDLWLSALRVRERDDVCALYALYEDGVPVATAAITGAGVRHAVLGGVAVQPDRRGHGLGGEIVRHMAALLLRTGRCPVVAVREEGVTGFYASLGFIRCGRYAVSSLDKIRF